MNIRVKNHEHPNYIFNGVKYPSVTQILGVINKPFLVPWANKLGKEGKTVNEVTQPSMVIGTLTHALIEEHSRWIAAGSRPHEPEKYLRSIYDVTTPEEEGIAKTALHCFGLYMDFYSEFKPEPKASELSIISKGMNYAGTIDSLCEIKGKKYLIDYKTSDKVYPEYKLQLAAYASLVQENSLNLTNFNAEEFFPEAFALLLLPKDSDAYEFCIYEYDEIMNLVKVFRAAQRIYDFLQEE